MADIQGVPRHGRTRALPQARQPAVVTQPRAHVALKRGVDAIVNAIRPTLGPLPRLVVMEGLRPTDLPEFLDDAATIARRIIEIRPRGDDVGAMLIRHALARMQRDAGDGGATMAVIYQALLHEGLRAMTHFGANAALLRNGLERALPLVLKALRAEATPLTGRAALSDLALSMCQGDASLAAVIGEVFDIVGADGLIVVEGWNRLGQEREYVEGTYWKLSGWTSRLFATEAAHKRTVFEDAALLITDFDLRDPQQLVPVLERCIGAGVKKLVITAAGASDAVTGLLVSNNKAGSIDSMIVRVPQASEMGRVAAMDDIAAMVGGRPLCAASFSDFESFAPADLGHARRIWATESMFGFFGGKGDPRKLRQHMAQVRGALRQADDAHQKSELQSRLGRLSGGTAILRVGGIHDVERDARKALAERAVTGMRNAVSGGVVAGGGGALLAAQAALAQPRACTPGEALAFQILARALEAPMRAIAHNAGRAPDVVIEHARAAGPGAGFDARNGRIVNMREARVFDSAETLCRALEIAVSGAALALTTDVIVHHRNPIESIDP